jgi:hypothetical protein
MAVSLRPNNTPPVRQRKDICRDVAVRPNGTCVRRRRGWAVTEAINDVRAWASRCSLRLKATSSAHYDHIKKEDGASL